MILKVSIDLKYFIPLFALLSIDIVLIVLNVVNFYHPFSHSDLYNIETDNSYAEDFQNLKWIIMIMATVMISLYQREKKYFTWILVFLFLFLEDVYRLHQILGHFFYDTFAMASGNRGSKIMELFSAAFVGFLFIAPAMQAYQTGTATFRKHTKTMFLLLVMFLFFAIVVDQVHRLAIFRFNWKYNVVLGTLEDGGELITESLLAGYLIYLSLKMKNTKKIV